MNEDDVYDSRESILNLFDEVDRDLNGQLPIEVYVVGYSAIVLARKNNRGSNDVDIIPSRFSRVFARHGLEIFDEHYFYLPAGYKSRAHEAERTYRSLIVKYADPHDIWFTKLGAFLTKDQTDMVEMIREGIVDPRKLDDLFEQWNEQWFNGSDELVQNYAEVRKNAASNDHP